MAIADAKRKKIGRELVEWIYLGIRAGARDSVAQYNQLAATNPLLAEQHLLRAVNMPVRARARINEARRVYELTNGVNTFNAFIGSCLSLAGTVTLAELNAELTSLEAQTAAWKTQHAQGATNAAIAASILSTWADDRSDWQFRIPTDYADTW